MVHKKLKPLFIISLAGLFFCYEFMLQSSPSVITNELLRDFHLDAASLSVLAAFFFYAYAPTQLLGGVLYDRFGPRLLMTVAVTICAIGALLFAYGATPAYLSAGRFCMGFGGAFSFVGTLVLASRWLPMRYFPVIVGGLLSIGSLAAIAGQVPMSIAVEAFGWRNCFKFLFFLGVVLAICYWLFIRDWPSDAEPLDNLSKNKHNIFSILIEVFTKPQTYFMAIYSFAIWSPITVFAALWGIPFVSAVYQVSIPVASTVAMMIWIGIAVGSPLFGEWSERIGKRCFPLSISALVGLIAALMILYVPMSIGWMYFMMFIFGMGAAGQSLIFAVVQDNSNSKIAGTAMGFNNLAVVAGGAICQPLAGYLLRLNWNGTVQSGIPVYNAFAFKQAMVILPVCYAAALVMSLVFIKETFCKNTKNT
jgi:MFS family permease